jgi:hypothetical protein
MDISDQMMKKSAAGLVAHPWMIRWQSSQF